MTEEQVFTRIHPKKSTRQPVHCLDRLQSPRSSRLDPATNRNSSATVGALAHRPLPECATTGAWEEDSHPTSPNRERRRDRFHTLITVSDRNQSVAKPRDRRRRSALDMDCTTSWRRGKTELHPPPPQDPDLASPDLHGALFTPPPAAGHQATAPPPKARSALTATRNAAAGGLAGEAAPRPGTAAARRFCLPTSCQSPHPTIRRSGREPRRR